MLQGGVAVCNMGGDMEIPPRFGEGIRGLDAIISPNVSKPHSNIPRCEVL